MDIREQYSIETKNDKAKNAERFFFVLLLEDNLRQFNLNNENSKSVSISTRFYPFKMKNTIDELICNPTLEIPCFFFLHQMAIFSTAVVDTSVS